MRRSPGICSGLASWLVDRVGLRDVPRQGRRRRLSSTAATASRRARTRSARRATRTSSEHFKAKSAGEANAPSPSIKTLKASEINATCLTCHEKGARTNWHGGVHDRRDVTCISCHSVHSYKSAKAQLKTARDFDTCFTCHKQMRAKFQRTSHHPLREGKMQCSNCHNPHDSTQPKMISARVDQREVLPVPHREARAVPLGARAGPRELRDLPRPARVEPPAPDRRDAAVSLPALPREQRSPRHALRQEQRRRRSARRRRRRRRAPRRRRRSSARAS